MGLQPSRRWPVLAVAGWLALAGGPASADDSGGPTGAPQGASSAAQGLAEADALIEQGRKLRREGKSDEAEATLKRALQIRRDLLGPEDPSVARAADELGSVYYNRGQYDIAEGFYRQALAIAEKALGPRNIEVASLLGDLGAALREEQKFAEAEKIVRRSLSIRTLLLPKDDPAIAGSLNNLGRNYLKQGRYRDAEAALLESGRIYRKAYGPDAPVVHQGDELLAYIKRAEAAPPPTEIASKGPEAHAPLTLGSGNTVTILNIGPLVSAEGWAGYVLVYETTVALADAAALRREVDEVWERFVIDAAKSGYDKALIVARSPPSSDAGPRPSANFLFTGAADGWRSPEREDRATKGLDPEFVRDVVARFDWLVEHHDGLAAMLYMAANWTATVKNTTNGETQNMTVDRDHFAAAVKAIDPEVRDYLHHRDIVAVSIDPDGRSAKIESRETETLERSGNKIATVGTSVDVLTLVGDHVEFTQSYEDATTKVGDRL